MSSPSLTRESFKSRLSNNLRCRWYSDQQLKQQTFKTKLVKKWPHPLTQSSLKANLEVSLINKNKLWCPTLNLIISMRC